MTFTYNQIVDITRTWTLDDVNAIGSTDPDFGIELIISEAEWNERDTRGINSLNDIVFEGITEPAQGTEITLSESTTVSNPVTRYIASPLTVIDGTDVYYKGSEIGAGLEDVPTDQAGVHYIRGVEPNNAGVNTPFWDAVDLDDLQNRNDITISQDEITLSELISDGTITLDVALDADPFTLRYALSPQFTVCLLYTSPSPRDS